MIPLEFSRVSRTLYVQLPNSWSSSDWISFFLALFAFIGLGIAYWQARQSRKDNAILRQVMINQINRESKIQIYSDTLASLRTICDLWDKFIANLKVELSKSGSIVGSGKPNLIPVLSYEKIRDEWEEKKKNSPSVSSVFTYEHKTQMDLLGDPGLVDEVTAWLDAFKDIQDRIAIKFNALLESHSRIPMKQNPLEKELKEIQTEAKGLELTLAEGLSLLGDHMREDLDVAKIPEHIRGTRHRKLIQKDGN